MLAPDVLWCVLYRDGLDALVVVAVHVVLPVAHVDEDVPLEPRLAGLCVCRAPSTLVVQSAHCRVREVTLHRRALEVRHHRGGLGHVQTAVPVSPGYGQQVVQGRGSAMHSV